jgi:flavorubredoxin
MTSTFSEAGDRAASDPRNVRIAIVYKSMFGGTRWIAEALTRGALGVRTR